MNTQKIASAIGSVVILLMVTACNAGQNRMGGSNSMAMDSLNYNWPQIIGGFLGGLAIGFLIGRRKR